MMPRPVRSRFRHHETVAGRARIEQLRPATLFMFATSSAVTIRRSARATGLMLADPIRGSKLATPSLLRSSRCRSPSSRSAIRPRSPRGSGTKASTPNTGNNAFEGSGIPAKSWIFAEGVPGEAVGIAETRGVETMWVLLIVLVGSAGVATTIIPGYPTKAECEAARAQIHRVPDLINLPPGWRAYPGWRRRRIVCAGWSAVCSLQRAPGPGTHAVSRGG